ncbi:CLUMA_CG020426, isoform A [Clunio marinus]|uniref:CLUMA_CG020426, isoform A n=1 Tax=Clunio marinus TaxID=568069 RepID=A0A1J1J8Y8_9DIPT|nr:CLUMA_CG020426, isoform A [Clunio marinus]
MIIFDRFLCCISLKTFGKFVGWVGSMGAIMMAYAMFLIYSVKPENLRGFKDYHIKSSSITTEDVHIFAGISFALLLLFTLIHILLIIGIKFIKSLAIIPHILLSVFGTAAAICLIPSEVHLSATDDHEATKVELIIAYIMIIIFSVYFTLCIYSLYELIKIEEKRRKSYRNCESVFITKIPK